MEDQLTVSEKLGIIDNLLENIVFDIGHKGAKFYNITIEEELVDGISSHTGKAFSTDGVNIFGFTYDDNGERSGIVSRLLSGTYIKDKGVSLYTIPFDAFFIQNNIMDTVVDATHRPDYTKMHGRFWNTLARVTITPETDVIAAETHVQPFIDCCNLWKDMDDEFTDRFMSLTTKAYQQDMNIAFINKLYDFAKDMPIPACFADDGVAPKTKM